MGRDESLKKYKKDKKRKKEKKKKYKKNKEYRRKKVLSSSKSSDYDRDRKNSRSRSKKKRKRKLKGKDKDEDTRKRPAFSGKIGIILVNKLALSSIIANQKRVNHLMDRDQENEANEIFSKIDKTGRKVKFKYLQLGSIND